MHRTIQLPTGSHPEWELSRPRSEGPDLKSVSESFVIAQSLRQSRNVWLSTMFPKFSVKTRGGRPAEVTPPPHTIKAHGKYDVHIGPHVFSNTAIYEVHYLPSIQAQGTEESQAMHHTSSAEAPTPIGLQSSLSSVAFPSGTYVTPALSARVTAAAQNDPVLANLLSAVINRTANEQQVKTLGYLIQSLDGVQPPGDSTSTVGDVTDRSATVPAPSRPFDIIVEFHERSSERFILPRGDVVCELAAPKSGSLYKSSDMIVTHRLPFSETSSSEQSAEHLKRISSEVISFRLSRVSQTLWELFSIWAGGPQKMEESKAKLAEIVRQAAPRSYLQYRVPEGELLAEIRSALAPSYTMRPVKPAGADSNRIKRKSLSRRPTTVLGVPSSSQDKAVPVKRRSQTKSKAPAPPPIACHSCGQTDVPLMMGGSKLR
ncbi:hypothetical protein BD414DRAFT_549743 [Trametes punicea]|nr:hypothetical protein BD414DRAFT_549743 [Trametes punicea]